MRSIFKEASQRRQWMLIIHICNFDLDKLRLLKLDLLYLSSNISWPEIIYTNYIIEMKNNRVIRFYSINERK